MRRALLLLVLPGALVRADADPAGDEALWQRMRDGDAVVLMRHAATGPGIGDPPGFTLGNCATQRNLSEAGRRDAAAIGAAFRQRGLAPLVWSSRWCRCLDTARLAFGQVQAEPALDSMFRDRAAQSATKLRNLYARLAARPTGTTLVLVTHDVNIRALTGQSLAPGELLLTRLRQGKLEALGRPQLALPHGAISHAALPQAVAQTPSRAAHP